MSQISYFSKGTQPQYYPKISNHLFITNSNTQNLMKKLIFILSLFLLSKLNAQNHFFEEGQTGYTVSGHYAISSFENLSDAHYGISSNYTFNGKLTLGLSFFILAPKTASLKGIVPYISYILFKESSDKGVFNFGANTSYAFYLKDQYKTRLFSIGPILYYQFNLGGGSKLSIGGEYNFGFIRIKIDGNNISSLYVNEEFDDQIINSTQNSYGFSANLLLNQFFIEPSIAFANDEDITTTLLGVSIGFIF